MFKNTKIEHKFGNIYYTRQAEDGSWDYHRENAPAILYQDGSEAWFFDGEKHRTGGEPAIIDQKNGRIGYYVHGKPHRVGGPAITEMGCSEFYFRNGIRHNLDGPAIKRSDGENEYFVYGIKMKNQAEFELFLHNFQRIQEDPENFEDGTSNQEKEQEKEKENDEKVQDKVKGEILARLMEFEHKLQIITQQKNELRSLIDKFGYHTEIFSEYTKLLELERKLYI